MIIFLLPATLYHRWNSNSKNINEFKAQIEQKKESIEEIKTKLADRNDHLKHKKGELDLILKETEKEENMLLKKSEDYKKVNWWKITFFIF